MREKHQQEWERIEVAAAVWDIVSNHHGARAVGAPGWKSGSWTTTAPSCPLQDLELGSPLEIEALLGAVVEMAGWVGVIAPISRAVLALVRQRAAMRGEELSA